MDQSPRSALDAIDALLEQEAIDTRPKQADEFSVTEFAERSGKSRAQSQAILLAMERAGKVTRRWWDRAYVYRLPG